MIEFNKSRTMKIYPNIKLNMKKPSFRMTLFILLSLFVFNLSNGQEVLSYGTTEESDYKILIATNRTISDLGDSDFIAELDYSNSGSFSFITANGNEENWTYTKETSFESMFKQEFKHNDWLVFIHGDSKTLQTAVDRAKEIQKLHNVNILIYSWPSKDPEVSPFKNFKISYSNVELASPYFKNFLTMIDNLKKSDDSPFQDENISLFLHSLGNYYLERMVNDNLHTGLDENLFDNLIINAAAVEEKGHKEWVEQLNFSRRIYINSNDDDFSLTGLRIISPLGRQLGEGPRSDYAENAFYVNFTEAVGFPGSMGPSHSYYFASITEKSENIKQFYTGVFHGYEAQLENNQLFAFMPKQNSFSIIF